MNRQPGSRNEPIKVTQSGSGHWAAETASPTVRLAAGGTSCDDAIDALRLKLAEHYGLDPEQMSVTLVGPSTSPGGRALERAIGHTDAALIEVDALHRKLEAMKAVLESAAGEPSGTSTMGHADPHANPGGPGAISSE